MLKKLKFNKAIALPIGFAVILAIASSVVYFVPKQQVESLHNVTDPNFANNEKQIAAETAARTALIQAVVGLFIATTAFIGWRQFLLAQEKQAAERFSKAVEQLGSSNIHVRLGGIYSLEQIAKDAEEKYYWQVMEQLTFFVREESPALPETSDLQAFPLLRRDLQEAMTVLSRRRYSYKKGEEHRLDLSNTDLRCLKLSSESNLVGIDFRGANLQNTSLSGVNLQKALFEGANLQKAYLTGANLQKALFEGANLQEALLGGANLQNTFFYRADLSKAYLGGANLQEAWLDGSNLQRAKLIGTKLVGVSFTGANLEKTDFRDLLIPKREEHSEIVREIFDFEVVKTAGLTWEQLDKARIYTKDLLPNYLRENPIQLRTAETTLVQASENSQLPENEAQPPQA